MTAVLKSFSRSELALRNGQERSEVWVGYKGFSYDVTRSKLWRSGKHYEHWAGQDLTSELKDAPHTAHVFEKFEKVGKISSE